jgi:hypothetical protein
MFIFRQKNKQPDAVTAKKAVESSVKNVENVDHQVVNILKPCIIEPKRVATFETMDTQGTCETRKMSNHSQPQKHNQLTSSSNTHIHIHTRDNHEKSRYTASQLRKRNKRTNYSASQTRARFAANARNQRTLEEEEDDDVSLWTTLLHHFRCGTACGFGLDPSSQADDPNSTIIPSMDDDMYLWSNKDEDQRNLSDLSEYEQLYLSDDHSTPTQSPTQSPTHSKSSFQP